MRKFFLMLPGFVFIIAMTIGCLGHPILQAYQKHKAIRIVKKVEGAKNVKSPKAYFDSDGNVRVDFDSPHISGNNFGHAVVRPDGSILGGRAMYPGLY